ncbi:MAG: hypothetical protein WAV84_15480 [Bacteroidota bacterium]
MKMKLRTSSRYAFRQLSLPLEYQQKMITVKQVIHAITGTKPSSDVTIMCMIDEFLSLHNEQIESEYISERESESSSTE